MGDRFQMAGVAARPVATLMIDLGACRYSSVRQCVGDPVSALAHTIEMNGAVARAVPAALPRPTTIW